jgi:predicted metalloendopeptidase
MISLVILIAVVPLGVLTNPYFLLKAPEYINYGTIGSIIAHEINHHFDSTGNDNCYQIIIAI